MRVDACGPMACAARMRPVGSAWTVSRPVVSSSAQPYATSPTDWVAVTNGGAGVVELGRGRSEGGDLRVAEDGVRHGAVVGGARLPGEPAEVDGEVVRHDPRLVVGDVLELVRRGDVAERPDPGRGGAQLLVDDEPAVVVQGQAAGGGVEPVGVGHPAHGEQHDLGLDVAGAARPGDVDPPDVAHALAPTSGSSTAAGRSGAGRPRCSAATPPPRGGAAAPARAAPGSPRRRAPRTRGPSRTRRTRRR